MGCEPVWGIGALMDGQDLALVPLWEETDLPAEGLGQRYRVAHGPMKAAWTSDRLTSGGLASFSVKDQVSQVALANGWPGTKLYMLFPF